jgi:hypothetical protein
MREKRKGVVGGLRRQTWTEPEGEAEFFLSLLDGWIESYLYQVIFLPNINVATFIPRRVTTRYNCEDNTFVPGGAITQYKCEAFVPGGEEAPPRPCERAFVPVGASNRYKCSYLYRGKKYPVQIKNRFCIYV